MDINICVCVCVCVLYMSYIAHFITNEPYYVYAPGTSLGGDATIKTPMESVHMMVCISYSVAKTHSMP